MNDMETMETIDLRELALIIMKWKWLVIIVPIILAVSVGAISTYTYEPEYESSSTLYVINRLGSEDAQIGLNDLRLSESLLKDFREIAKQRVIVNTVINELNLQNQYTYDQLVRQITINLKNDTRIMELRVRDKDRNRAFELTEKLTDVMSRKVVEVMNIEAVNILDKPIIPTRPIANNIKLQVMIAFVLGIMLSIGFIFIKEYFDNTLKTTEDIEKYLKLPAIVNIPVIPEKGGGN